MKTKFVKVSVEERLPEKGKNVIVLSVDGKIGTCYFLTGLWHGQKNGEPKYWLEEVPDREAEMIDMLKIARGKFLDLKYDKNLPELHEIQNDIEKLIQEATTLK